MPTRSADQSRSSAHPQDALMHEGVSARKYPLKLLQSFANALPARDPHSFVNFVRLIREPLFQPEPEDAAIK